MVGGLPPAAGPATWHSAFTHTACLECMPGCGASSGSAPLLYISFPLRLAGSARVAALVGSYPFADSNMAKADMPSHDEDSSTAAGHEWPNDFVGRLQLAWEQASEGLGKSASTHGTGVDTRRVVVRTGVVLGRGGGAVQQMWYPFKCCLGGVIGAGTQPFPWVHIDDRKPPALCTSLLPAPPPAQPHV